MPSTLVISGRIYNAIKKFTSNKAGHKNLRSPWYKDGKIFATDGYTMFRWTLPQNAAEELAAEGATGFTFEPKAASVKAADKLPFTEEFFNFDFNSASTAGIDGDNFFNAEAETHAPDLALYVNAKYVYPVLSFAKTVGTEFKCEPLIWMSTAAAITFRAKVETKSYGVFDFVVMSARPDKPKKYVEM